MKFIPPARRPTILFPFRRRKLEDLLAMHVANFPQPRGFERTTTIFLVRAKDASQLTTDAVKAETILQLID